VTCSTVVVAVMDKRELTLVLKYQSPEITLKAGLLLSDSGDDKRSNEELKLLL